jgi:acyl transferase domain-containing protein
MIVVSGVAGALVGPLPWPIATLPGFVHLLAAREGWLVELVRAALADAGRNPDDLAWHSVGVYAAGNGATACALAQRWDWCGPALGVDAECAGGLVALLQAADALALGQCTLAVVVAEHVVLGGPDGIEWDQNCAPLAAAAREGAPRAGAAVVVMERSADARRCRARFAGGVHRRLGSPQAMIGLSLRGIVELVRQGLAWSRLTPGEIGYCELHALGTPVGDAVELAALSRVWAEGGNVDRPTRLGSNKAGFGHLEAASGLVSLARLVAWFDSGVLPPTAWRRPFTTLASLPASLALCDGGAEAARAAACLALSRSGIGAIAVLEPAGGRSQRTDSARDHDGGPYMATPS